MPHPLPAYFTTKQSTDKASLFVIYLNTCVTKFHGKSLNFCRKDKSCDLNDAERHAHPKHYEGCIYMDVSESPKVCPFNIFPMLKYITNVKKFIVH